MLLKIFNEIGNKEMQDTFLSGLIVITDIVRCWPINNTKPNRSVACKYKVHLDRVNEIYVCKNEFCSIFGIGKGRVERIISQTKNSNPSPKDMRGKFLIRPNKVSDMILFQFKTHIPSFPKQVSHYRRHDNNQKCFLSAELSINKIYEMYIEKYEPDIFEKLKNGENVRPIVKYQFFTKYFNTNFNFIFWKS